MPKFLGEIVCALHTFTDHELRLSMYRFAFQIFLSAFLLFQIQPIVARFMLPTFGGASNVWTVCLVFFQIFLLLGYWYAYLLDRWLSPFKQACVHAALVCVSLVAYLPLSVKPATGASEYDSPLIAIVYLLVSTVGLPYALISASGPLFQNWFRTQFPHKNTYRLYALSNVGSLLGLLSYPFLIEPVLSLQQQALFWSVGFFLYFLWTLACLWTLRNVSSIASEPEGIHSGAVNLNAADVIIWVSMAAIATTLLLATTNKITMDIASVPFLWILPLTLYLLSFIICFDRSSWYDRRFWIPLLFVVTIVGLNALLRSSTPSIYFQLFAYLSVLFVGCMVCHGELYRLRPNPKLLTRYYLLISFGGAVGGVFVALVAPKIFDGYIELQLSWVALFFVSGLCVIATSRFRNRLFDLSAQLGWTVWIVFLSLFLFYFSATEKQNVLQQVRGFYGVLKLVSTELPVNHASGADRYLRLLNGSIVHGGEFYKNDEALFLPSSYYSAESGIGKAIKYTFPDEGGLDVGVVGMGVATISTLCKTCESLLFYEIDQNVVEFERKYFSNLERIRAEGVDANVLIGDGRLLLDQQFELNARPQFDVLAVDAFSGDSIPVHLLTREAIDLYMKHLRAKGVLAIHVSNRHLDLSAVVGSLATDLGLKAALVLDRPGEDKLTFQSDWIVLSRDDEFFKRIASDSVSILELQSGHSWTDEYSNLLGVLR